MLKIIVSLLMILTSLSSFASEETPCPDLLLSDLIPSEERPLTIPDVEVYRRNNNIGQQQKGSIEFSKWMDLHVENPSWQNTLGITPDGRVFHVVQSKTKRVGRLLSGTQNIKEIYLYKHQVLVAVDSSNNVFLFSPRQWLTSPLKTSVKRGLLLWGGSAALAMIGVHLGEPLTIERLPEVIGYVSAMTALTSFFAIVQRFDRINTFPNGLQKTDWTSQRPKDLIKNLSSKDIEDLKVYFSEDHFTAPDLDRLEPTGPESAQEDIRK
ncbi:hypothetical protein GW916_13255 [bacterium]|nr:hypothetical protein [bacterium]